MAVGSKERGTGSSQSLSRKVKSGCGTCKRRKVKCDEKWPICTRCQSTDRTCAGYGIWGGGSQDTRALLQGDSRVRSRDSGPVSPTLIGVQSNPGRPIPLIKLSDREEECFDWFMCRSAVKLPGAFVSYHWTTTLLQAGMAEPAVRHAMLALGSAHKEEVQGLHSQQQDPKNRLTIFTTSQYSKSIRHLQPYLKNASAESLRVTLIACALFVSMEFLRGQYTQGMLHLGYGLNLLREVKDDDTFRIQDPRSLCVDGWIITLLTRNLVQAKLFGQMSHLCSGDYLNLDPGVHVTIFRNIHHARRSLEHLMLQAMDLQQCSYLQAASGAQTITNTQMLASQAKMQAELQVWLQIYDTTMSSLSPNTYTVLERFAFRLLQLYYYLAVVMVGTCLNTLDETKFDHYESTFANIISHCTETYEIVLPTIKLHPKASFHHDPELSSPQSTSDLGWIPPLYYTALKCRNHHIRHQAIRFLQWHSHKEGVWDSILAVLIAKKVVELEEGGAYPQSQGHRQTDQTVADPLLDEIMVPGPTIPAKRLLTGVEVSPPNDDVQMLILKYYRLNDSGVLEWSSSECDYFTHRWTDHQWTTSAEDVS